MPAPATNVVWFPALSATTIWDPLELTTVPSTSTSWPCPGWPLSSPWSSPGSASELKESTETSVKALFPSTLTVTSTSSPAASVGGSATLPSPIVIGRPSTFTTNGESVTTLPSTCTVLAKLSADTEVSRTRPPEIETPNLATVPGVSPREASERLAARRWIAITLAPVETSVRDASRRTTTP